jgi:hypothetical protein
MSKKPRHHVTPTRRSVRCLLLAVGLLASMVGPVSAHDAVVPPGTPPEQHSRYAFSGGFYAPAERAPMVWFERGFPGGTRKAENPFKAAFWRGVSPWNARGRDFYFRNSGFVEVDANLDYYFLARTKRAGGRPEETNDLYKAWCNEKRDDPTVEGLNEVYMNLIYWENPPRNGTFSPLGEVAWCHRYPAGATTAEPYKFAMSFQTEKRGWWKWRGRRKGNETIRSDQTDFQAVVTHELGHAAGFSAHFPEGEPKTTDCTSTSTDPAAMCRTADCGVDPSARETMCQGAPFGGRDTLFLRSLGEHDKHTFRGAYPNPR